MQANSSLSKSPLRQQQLLSKSIPKKQESPKVVAEAEELTDLQPKKKERKAKPTKVKQF